MKEIKLTQGKVAIVDDDDYEELSKYKWYYATANKDSGCGYAVRNSLVSESADRKQHTIKMHRFILGLTDTEIQADHIDGNGLDNRRTNLRACTSQQNIRNHRVKRKNNKSGYRGVCWFKPSKRWRAEIRHNTKLIYLGQYKDPIEAAKAYDKKAKELFGDFCGELNFT